MNNRSAIGSFLIVIAVVLGALGSIAGAAQDAREALGPRDATGDAAWKRAPHPLKQIMETAHSKLRPELRGQHPRVYVTEDGLKTLRLRARTTHREVWRAALDQVRALRKEPPPAPAQERRAQNDVGIGIAEAALAYKIEGDKKYLDAARKYMEAAVSYEVWGYTYNKPNVDLAAGHLLYGMGWGYDLLFNDLTETERKRYRDKIAKHARMLVGFYEPKRGRTFSYSQNHVFIPMAGLGAAAYALYDEVEDAPEWAAFARAVYDRVLATYSTDGYYYEGFEYWIFSTPWLVHYLDAHAHATGEDLYDRPGFRKMHKYVAHSMLPSGKYVFDFGDIYEGPLTRAGQGDEYRRANPGGRFHTNYNILFRIAQRFRDGEAQGVAQWMKSLDHYNAENYWSLLWYEPSVKAVPIRRQKPWHYFEDHGVVYWRSSWTPAATAFAFKAGPPEGHHTTELLRKFPDWHLSSGHAHPDAGSFIIYARGSYLTGDSGYAGVPLTAHHNTVLIDGRGQAKEGKGHDAFDDVPYDQLNRIRIVETKLDRNEATIRAEISAAYDPELGVSHLERVFQFTREKYFAVRDHVETREPRVFSSLLHADDRVVSMGEGMAGEKKFNITTPAATMGVLVVSPQDVSATVEPNDLTAPGRPGAVDKGEKQVRGERLAVSTVQRNRSARLMLILTVEGLSRPVKWKM